MKFPRSAQWSLGATTVLLVLLGSAPLPAAPQYEPKPADPYFDKFNPIKAPEFGPLLLQPNDRLVIIGDSITEQKRYSRLIEDYVTACVPELHITVRQLGWSGETAEGFRKRMESDCLRFHPTVATINYGMNDSKYRPFDLANGEWYRENYAAIVDALKASGARVVIGSPGCVGKMATWTHSKDTTKDEHNLNLCTLRDIDVELAESEQTPFADVFWNLYQAGFAAQKYASPDHPYELCGHDGVHPNWSGHLVMAYSYLRAMGLDPNVGTIRVDLATSTATATSGHDLSSFADNTVTVVSHKYPFCADGDPTSDQTLRSGATLVPFFHDLSQFNLIVTHAPGTNYQVIWSGGTNSFTNTYTATQLADGVNLAEDYVTNPFSEAFGKVDAAVTAKQKFETKQIKDIFHGEAGKSDINKAVADTEAERAPLEAAVTSAVVPVTHTIRLVPVD